MATHVLETDRAAITYDVHGVGGRPLMMIGQPMDASGFAALRAQFPDRTVITYDPRGLGRSTRSDGSTENRPEIQAADVHAVIESVGGPVDLFASSGGAVTGLELVASYPDRYSPSGLTPGPDGACKYHQLNINRHFSTTNSS